MRSVLLGLLAVTLTPIWACSCSPMGTGPPCQAAWGATAVFTANVISITEPPLPPIPGPRGPALARRTVDDPGPSLPWPKRVVRMQIGEVLTGVDPGQKEIEIVTGKGGGDCGYAFQSGAAYVVYAYKNSEGRLETGICSRTRPLAQAAEDVAYIRSVATAPATGEIRIVTGLPGTAAVPGVRTSIDGGGLHQAASADAAGQARFEGLPPGEYKVTAELEGYLPADRTVRLHAAGCAEVPFYMALDRRITGRVMTKDGLPAAGVDVEVRATQDMLGDSVKTDAEGRYELRRFRAGGYYLGINLSHTPTLENPYTRWFYPGTEDPASAAIVRFSDTPETQHYDLTLPDRQKDRVIKGTVQWPDGRPAAAARLFVLDPRWLWQSAGAQVTTDANGRFLLHVLDGTHYRLHAVSVGTPPNRTASAEPVEIQPGNSPLGLTLVLTRPGNSLSEDQRKGTEQFRNRQ